MSAADKTRPYEMMAIIGPPAYGKTSLTDELAERYRKEGGRVWICDPSNNWRHARSRWPSPGAFWPENGLAGLDDALWTLRSVGPGLLILDDADYYMRFPTNARLELMTSFRHWQKDVLIVTRRPQGIPKDAIANADALALFAQREVYSRDYIGKQLGNRKIAAMIPTERYRYLYVRQDDDGAPKVFATTKRATSQNSDRD